MNTPPRILLHNDQTSHLAARLQDRLAGAEVIECNDYVRLPDAIASFTPDIVYTVRFAGTPGFPRAALFADGGPKWVANGGVGTDHFGVWDMSRTTVTNAAGVAADMMAEYCLGGFLRFALDHPGLEANRGARNWQARTVTPLKGKTLLIVGLGHTGRALAERAKAFGMTVIGTRARPRATAHVDIVFPASELPEALPKADAIAICTPLTSATKHLIGPSEIALMKRGVLLADVSRGGVVDQDALADALAANHIAGAAIDVFETEPLPPESPLWEANNAILSPHCASVYDGWEDASFDMFLENLTRWTKGQPLNNVVDPERGY